MTDSGGIIKMLHQNAETQPIYVSSNPTNPFALKKIMAIVMYN